MRRIGLGSILRAMQIACLALLVGLLPAVAAPRDDLDELLDGAEKAMQDSIDNLRQNESGRSLNDQSDSIQKLEAYQSLQKRASRTPPNTNLPTITSRDLENLL